MVVGSRLIIQNKFLHGGADFAMNVWKFIVTASSGDNDATQMADIAAAFESLWETYLNGFVHGDVEGTQITFYKAPPGGGEYSHIGDVDWAISLSTNSEPGALSNAALVKFGVSGRKRDAGKFIYGLREDIQRASRLNSAAMTGIALWGANIADGIVTTSVTINPILEPGYPEDLSIYYFNGSASCRQITSPMAKRKPGRGI